MEKLKKEEKIFEAALEALRANFVFPIHFDVIAEEKWHDLNKKIDKVLKVTMQNKEITFCVEIKNLVVKPMIGLLDQQRLGFPHPVLFVTNYVNNFMADNLRKNNIEFVDTAGNAFINQPPIYVFIKGNRPNEDFIKIPKGQAFRATGLKAILAFLQYPDLINETYRDIARVADIALGNIGWIITDLKKQGFVLDMGLKRRKLVNKKKLLELFVEEYPRKLREKLLLGRYRSDQGEFEKENIDFKNALWGGEVAAAMLTGYLKPEDITIYVKQKYLDDLLLKNRLKKDAEGKIEILEMFWEPLVPGEFHETVEPILVYADLMATGDQRNIETAKVIFERYIQKHIGED